MFGAVALLAGYDLVSELGEGVSSPHWLLEGALFVLGVAGAVSMLGELRRISAQAVSLQDAAADLTEALEAQAEEAAVLSERLEVTAQEAARFREEAQSMLRGLADAIDKQLHRWELTRTEKEVALLLLKGLSHREIAANRGTTDATTRQQARALYRKAGLKGRNDLAAFFLEDLLVLPQGTGEHAV
jgi:DNA-binding NarL/FixJ family response regulator